MATVIVDPDKEQDEAVSTNDREAQLVAWVMSRVDDGREARDQVYKEKWQEYYRLWRGIWAKEDQSRSSERSKLISPALQSAVESTVSEQEEAIFGRKQWFDLVDDYKDRIAGEDKDLQQLRDCLLERFDEADVAGSMARMFLNAAIYGTGIGKVVTEERIEKVVKPSLNKEQAQNILMQAQRAGMDPRKALESQMQWEVVDEVRLLVKLDPIDPADFVIDPASRTVEEAEFCAHETYKPEHVVLTRQKEGVYRNVPVGTVRINRDAGDVFEDENADAVKIVEYYGLVPESLLDVDLEDGEELVELDFKEGDEPEEQLDAIDLETEDLVEAIVTIANDGYVLRAIANPFWGQDRPILAFQHDTVPNSFWGRGICEKGYNSQKALDAELRARMDGLALSVHPMMAFDVTRMPRGSNFTVHPGKSIPTNGNPREVLSPFNFGNIDPLIFQSSGDLERMVQVATGTTDPSAPLNVAPRNSTASGQSMALSSAIKRSKRTLANIERNIIKPFLKKAAWRFMQLDPDNFPVKDLQFTTHSTLGITARELEQQQLISLLQTVPPDSPAFLVMLKAIYSNSSLSNKEEMVTVVEQMMKPNPQQQQLQQMNMQLEMADKKSKIEERNSRTAENYADIKKTLADIGLDQDKLDLELQKEILDLLSARANKQNGNVNGSEAQEVLRRPVHPNRDPRMGNPGGGL